MSTVVSIGCSHTHGSMIDGKNGTSVYNKEHAYGAVVASRLGYKHINMGLPGGSNQYIQRATVKFINNYMDPNEDYIFLIGWTSSNRIEMRYPEDKNYEHVILGDLMDLKYVPFSMGTNPKLFHTKEMRQMIEMSPLFFDNDTMNYNWATYAYTLEHMFKSMGLKYYMFNTCHELPVNAMNKKIVESLDNTYYLDPTNVKNSMLYWGLDRGFEKTECWHLKEDGHMAWGDSLVYKLKEIGLV